MRAPFCAELCNGELYNEPCDTGINQKCKFSTVHYTFQILEAKMPKKKGSKPLGLEDDRFTHLRSDPKYSGLSNREKKVSSGQWGEVLGERMILHLKERV